MRNYRDAAPVFEREGELYTNLSIELSGSNETLEAALEEVNDSNDTIENNTDDNNNRGTSFWKGGGALYQSFYRLSGSNETLEAALEEVNDTIENNTDNNNLLHTILCH